MKFMLLLVSINCLDMLEFSIWVSEDHHQKCTSLVNKAIKETLFVFHTNNCKRNIEYSYTNAHTSLSFFSLSLFSLFLSVHVCGSVVKNLLAHAGDAGSIPGLERSSGEGNDNPLQYSCLGNPINKGGQRTTVHGVAKELDTT